ncbi:uncharacterized protein P174DRAFT_462805 [Aspergillus novofumigatus IBT 16806]|uniref:Uncharacterized protein n=1 Tax=Aspergillus novofumigatus (strain IBT 16806) TaxID=1392255 RepID=A0A2I1BZ40_ASPN1|nr:uncharacterized protein P174DRAFT_462805 [Aspergillus novofumigatus IBT 16806]PKX90621.1 hypothetical protein P174DRAFT_462805 [Aspergillus novofumigatus IBT 16806]
MFRAQHQPGEARAKAKDLTASRTLTRRQGFLTYYFSEAARKHKSLLVHRAGLHEGLLVAVLASGSGSPAELQTSSEVVDIDPYHATLTLGERRDARRRTLSSQYLLRLQGRGGDRVSGLQPACSRIQGSPIKVTRVARQPKLPS